MNLITNNHHFKIKDMREIKFRAYVHNRGIYFLTGFQTHINSNGITIFPLDSEGLEMDSWYVFKPPPIIMQYTGLKDKNGKEIYEGDILQGKPLMGWTKDELIKASVIFDVERGMWIAEEIHQEYSEREYLFELTKDSRHEIKVVGNIHANK